MATKLTKKQRGFVKDYVKTGIGSLAVKKNYDVSDDGTARNIASENLAKPNIQKAIAERIPDDLLEQRHLELLNKREIQLVGGELIDRGPDVQGVSKGLDMAYKLKGSYAAEKSVALNLNINDRKMENEDLEAIREEYEEKLKAKLIE